MGKHGVVRTSIRTRVMHKDKAGPSKGIKDE